MKTEHYNHLEKKYLEGLTTSEEERFLKEHSEDVFFSFLKEEKNHKMNWDFDDFLNKTSEQNHSKPVILAKTKSINSKILWLAACIMMIFGLALGYFFVHQKNINTQDLLVKKEILNQKKDHSQDKNLAQQSSSITKQKTTDSLELDSLSATINNSGSNVVDKILSKKDRIKKFRVKYAKSSKPNLKTKPYAKPQTVKSETPEYQSSFVMVNGEKITDEKEAIDVAKYSFQLISEKMSKTLANTNTLEHNNLNDN